jgi:hypothetical protein
MSKAILLKRIFFRPYFCSCLLFALVILQIPQSLSANSAWQQCNCQWLADTCTGGAVTGTTKESCQEMGGTYWHTNGHCGKGKCNFSKVCPMPGHYCYKSWQQCDCQWLADTCTGGAVTGTTKESCQEMGGTYWHTNGHCGKGKCNFSKVCPMPGHYCFK